MSTDPAPLDEGDWAMLRECPFAVIMPQHSMMPWPLAARIDRMMSLRRLGYLDVQRIGVGEYAAKRTIMGGDELARHEQAVSTEVVVIDFPRMWGDDVYRALTAAP